MVECSDLLMRHPCYKSSHAVDFIHLGHSVNRMLKKYQDLLAVINSGDDTEDVFVKSQYEHYIDRPKSMENVSYW